MTEALTIIAILFSPLIAVLVTRWLDERRERRQRKLWVLQTLFATRFSLFADDRIRAFNSIDLVFQDNADVRNKWGTLLKTYTTTGFQSDENLQREGQRQILELLTAMSRALGYATIEQMDVDRSYMPIYFTNQAAQTQQLVKSIMDFFAKAGSQIGQPSSAVANTPLPPSPPPGEPPKET